MNNSLSIELVIDIDNKLSDGIFILFNLQKN